MAQMDGEAYGCVDGKIEISQFINGLRPRKPFQKTQVPVDLADIQIND